MLFQAEVVTASDPGMLIDGVHVDVDDVLAPDFGQWDLPANAGNPGGGGALRMADSTTTPHRGVATVPHRLVQRVRTR